MIFPESQTALDNFYNQNAILINSSEGRYNLTELLNMIPWEFQIYLGKYSRYLDKINKE